MSTCESNKLNYYCANRDNVDYYCTGVYQQEPGIKYFLSKYPIDEIIAIASDTILKNSPAIVENESFRITDLQGKDLGEKEYHILSKRINDFINGENEDFKEMRKSIDVTRREDISNIVYEATKDISVKSISEAETLSKVIQDRIRKDVEEKFISPDDYSKYHVEKLSQYEEIETYIHEEEKYRNYMNTVWDVKDKFNDDLNREGYLVQSLEYYKMKSLEYYSAAKAEKEVIIRLNDAIGRLIYEIKVIREKRIETEQEYAKSLIYEWLKQQKEIKPLEENKNVFLRIVPAHRNNIDNINGILDAIKGDGTAEKINVYIDMQGGSRTDGYVRQAVLSILNNEIDTKVLTKEIVAINYERGKLLNGIVNESERYGINDLVAGMNAFIQYGKAEMVLRYAQKGNTEEVNQLISAMIEVDDALSFCDTKRLTDALSKIKQFYKCGSTPEGVFSVLTDGIRKDYGKLLEGDEIDVIELIRWCLRKKFYQQAITIIESLMPREIVKAGILYYADVNSRDDDFARWKQLYIDNVNDVEKSNQPTYKWEDLCHYFIKDLYWNKIIKNRLRKIEKDNNIAYALDNSRLPVKIYFLYNDKPKIQKLISLYSSISDYRNKVNHASGNKTETKEDILKVIDDFVNLFCEMKTIVGQKSKSVRIFEFNEIRNAANTSMNANKEKVFVVSNSQSNTGSNEKKVKNTVKENNTYEEKPITDLESLSKGVTKEKFIIDRINAKGRIIGTVDRNDAFILPGALPKLAGKSVKIDGNVSITVTVECAVSDGLRCVPADADDLQRKIEKYINDGGLA
ncbi:MAG: hypothetical protein MJ119_02230 [Lachnospiraceae bacterium]|nr:hypothetical protein [Lachnospiraceae bacterium]